MMMTMTMVMMMLLPPRRTLDSSKRLPKNMIAQAVQRNLPTDGCQSTAKACSASYGKLWYQMWFDLLPYSSKVNSHFEFMYHQWTSSSQNALLIS